MLATKTEAVAFMAYLLGENCESLRGLGLLNRDDNTDSFLAFEQSNKSATKSAEEAFIQAQTDTQGLSMTIDNYSLWWEKLQ